MRADLALLTHIREFQAEASRRAQVLRLQARLIRLPRSSLAATSRSSQCARNIRCPRSSMLSMRHVALKRIVEWTVQVQRAAPDPAPCVRRRRPRALDLAVRRLVGAAPVRIGRQPQTCCRSCAAQPVDRELRSSCPPAHGRRSWDAADACPGAPTCGPDRFASYCRLSVRYGILWLRCRPVGGSSSGDRRPVLQDRRCGASCGRHWNPAAEGDALALQIPPARRRPSSELRLGSRK